ncbi:hypothetical protein K3718_20275 (plasmid) [Leisingera aquaemixtae]|uniref:Uncharacterized protein n=1 Tax=Leisingera aquaemixtae TaxID=1396826 RepID=A0ABY5WQU7_9RHOB|nr:hypothetical protein [Leisingera aquaemixtae]UWQ43744.1 hypothetical protein K3718_20275 [Leisingera aquaemixtae]
MNKLTLEAPVQGPPAPAGSPARPAQPRPAQAAPAQATSEPAPSAQATSAQATSEPAPSEPAQAQAAPDKPAPPPRLSAAVLAQIAKALRQGGPDAPPLAAQADLVALHKRIAEMFTTLNDGLGAQAAQKAAADRAALSARIDQLETAVNRMEGALRIELEPVLKAAVAEALAQAAPKPRRRWPRVMAAALALAGALAAGAWWHTPLLALADSAAPALAGWLGRGG